MGKLKVQLIEGRDLMPADLNGALPYISLSFFFFHAVFHILAVAGCR
jgi:hypothetical protein